MREIKFRVWDDSVNRYIYWDDIGKLHNLWNILDWDRHHYTPEQYTGLKDKNGKEIYEGDVSSVVRYGQETRYPVKFIDGSFSLPGSGLVGPDENLRTYVKCMEIIGNIHENPELINER